MNLEVRSKNHVVTEQKTDFRHLFFRRSKKKKQPKVYVGDVSF